MRARTIATALFAVALLGLPTARPAAAGPGTKVADAPYEAAFRSRVRAAIQKGVTHLRTKQVDPQPNRFGGTVMDDLAYEEAAAVLWTLRRAGAPADDPVFATIGTILAKRKPKTLEEACLVMLGMSASPLPDGDPFALADPSKPAAAQSLSKADLALVQEIAKVLIARQVPEDNAFKALGEEFNAAGGWLFELEGPLVGDMADLPSTYLALLSLESAARCGVSVPSKVWLSALKLLLRWQAAKGRSTPLAMNQVRGADRWQWTERASARGFGWSGGLADDPSGYETAAGAVGIVVCQDALQKDKAFAKLKVPSREAVRDAMAWIQQNYDITKNPSTPSKGRKTDIGSEIYHHHWLQALSRLEIHARMRLVGTHDWYLEGGEELLRTQRADGSWEAIWWSNCYALLFLMRASLTSTAPVFTVSENDPGK